MLGQRIYNTLEKLSKFSEEGEGVTRLYLTKEHKKANDFILNLMEEVGLQAKIDPIGNVIGEYKSKKEDARTLVIGSHIDTVICGGKYDGALGVILPIITIGEYLKENPHLDYNLKVISFGDEEGVRFFTLFLGSKIVAGYYEDEILDKVDKDGTSLRKALEDFGLDPLRVAQAKIEDIDSYLEVHIEQGPVLESKNLGVGIVNAIQASRKYEVSFTGMAGHAGTIPMKFRQDAGVGASEGIYKVNKYAKKIEGLVATIGKVEFLPGAGNVIPGEAKFTLDMRALDEDILDTASDDIKSLLKVIAYNNSLSLEFNEVARVKTDLAHKNMTDLLEKSFISQNQDVEYVSSGAGHDAQIMCKRGEMGMMFVRCEKGISHNPLENVRVDDLDLASNILREFLNLYK